MLDFFLSLADMALLAALFISLILGLSCVAMACLSTKKGAEAIKERVEYGFMGVSGLAIMALLVYASL